MKRKKNSRDKQFGRSPYLQNRRGPASDGAHREFRCRESLTKCDSRHCGSENQLSCTEALFWANAKSLGLGSRSRSLGIRGTADLLDNRFRLVWKGRRTALPRHQTLNSMLDWSYNLLTEPEKETLSRLSVFVGAFSIK